MIAGDRPPSASAKRDAAQAEAFRELESDVNNARAAVIVADTIWEHCDHPGILRDGIVERIPALAGHTILVLTEEEYEALQYALGRVRKEVDSLRAAYLRASQ